MGREVAQVNEDKEKAKDGELLNEGKLFRPQFCPVKIN